MAKVLCQDISAYSVMATSPSCMYFHITLQNSVQSFCFTLTLTFINSAVELQISSEELDICLSSSFLQTVSLSEGTFLGNIPRAKPFPCKSGHGTTTRWHQTHVMGHRTFSLRAFFQF